MKTETSGEKLPFFTLPKHSALMTLMCLLALCFISCFPKPGPTLIEDAVVEDVIYTPAFHGQISGSGFSSSGDVSFSSGSVKAPPSYSIIFRCEHGRFVIDGSSTRNAKIFALAKPGQKMQIEYRELLKKDKGGNVVIGYDFIDARPIQEFGGAIDIINKRGEIIGTLGEIEVRKALPASTPNR